MKILITGFNNEQVHRDYFLRKEIKVLLNHYSLIRCLEDMGHTVEQRPVNIGEDLSVYDEVILYIHSIQGFCQRSFDGLWVLQARPDCIVAFDDWQVIDIFRTIKNYRDDLLEDENRAFRQYLFDLYQGTTSKEKIVSMKNQFIDACDVALAKKNRLLMGVFKGGDLDLFGLEWPKDRVFTYNPNAYNLNRRPENNYGLGGGFFADEVVRPENKKEEWIFASLVQLKTRKWIQDLKIEKWPIQYYGQRRGELKDKRVTEPEMCKVYNETWGCLMPAYYHAGSGWWRGRVQQVADVRSIMVCDDREGRVYGEAYVGVRPEDVENMDVSQRAALAQAQHDCLYDNHPLDKEEQKRDIQAILEASK